MVAVRVGQAALVVVRFLAGQGFAVVQPVYGGLQNVRQGHVVTRCYSLPTPSGQRSIKRPRDGRFDACACAFPHIVWPEDNKLGAKLPDKSTQTSSLPAGLYIIATPIGNLEDMTLRGLRMLREVDMIACEDTRTSKKLLEHYDIHKPLIPYHEHSHETDREKLVELVRQGKAVALISDAGTPLISDPGFKLARAVRAEGGDVTTAPGACAAVAALTLSSMPTDRFYFAGFVPNKASARAQWLRALESTPGSWVMYESTHRIVATMEVIASLWPKRQVALVREITKKYEEVICGDAEAVADDVTARGGVKGEIVIVIGPADADDGKPSEQQLDDALRLLLVDHTVKEAAKILAEQYGLPKRDIYNRALKLKDG